MRAFREQRPLFVGAGSSRGQGVEDVGAAGVPHPERTDRRPVHREPHQLGAQRQVPRDFLRRQLGATLVVKHKAAEN